MPSKFYNYLDLIRINKPTGLILVFSPVVFGVLLASSTTKDLYILFLLAIASFFARAAGCIINDLFDQNIDKKVKRTKDRPLAAGKVTENEAKIILILCLSVCLYILLQLSVTSIMLGIISCCMMSIYPLMKRIIFFPQLFLGLTFNLGVLIGYTSITDDVNFEAFLLYIGCCFWTVGYDTIYAFMDISDDKKIRVGSLAIVLEDKNYLAWLVFFYSIFMLIFVTSEFRNMSNIFYATCVLSYIILLWQAVTLDIKSDSNCLKRFNSNNYVGIILSLGLILDFFA